MYAIKPISSNALVFFFFSHTIIFNSWLTDLFLSGSMPMRRTVSQLKLWRKYTRTNSSPELHNDSLEGWKGP